MSLSLVTPRIISRFTLHKIVVIRAASHSTLGRAAEKQVQIKGDGFFKYERDWSRDKKISNPQKPGDTPARFLLRRLGHAYELYPLFVLTGVWFGVFLFTIWYSFEKVEIWLDRSKSAAPWDWERLRDSYWKKPSLLFDTEGKTHNRLEIMEKLQDEMLAAAKARGTR